MHEQLQYIDFAHDFLAHVEAADPVHTAVNYVLQLPTMPFSVEYFDRQLVPRAHMLGQSHFTE